MLIVFSSNATGDITMFGDVAERMFELMGHSGTIPSAIAAKDVPTVLERLKAAIEAQNNEGEDDYDDNQDTVADTEDEEDEPKVSVAGRAFPLIQMLSRAADENCSVMWRKQ
jgi:rubrerythrin